MEVEASCSSSRHYPQEMDQLLEAFGSAFSIEYIASTYLQANGNIDMAGEVLCELQATAASSASHQPKEDTTISPRVHTGSCKTLDLGEHPVLTGCTSEVTQKDYQRVGKSKGEQSSLKGSFLPRMGTQESMISDISAKTSLASGRVAQEPAHKDIADFLFKMLGDGFQLDMEMIHEVLSSCGYDLKKSVETLLDESASSTLGRSDGIVGKAPEISRSNEKLMDLPAQVKPQYRKSVRSSVKRNKGKNDLEKELLQSLFTTSNILEEEPKRCRLRKPTSRSGQFGTVVTVPLEDTTIEQKILYITPLQASKEEDEDSFHVLSQAVKEHWDTMKQYYKAAGEAFLKGDYARADRLREKGHFFSKKAREVDDMSLQKIVETGEGEDELLLDFSDIPPKESVHHLRSHLSTLCGISSIPYLKVKLGNGEGRAKEEGSRRRMIIKLLENESIKWTEEEEGNIISIRVDEIDHKSLSFSKK